jgi:hypothetical protein
MSVVIAAQSVFLYRRAGDLHGPSAAWLSVSTVVGAVAGVTTVHGRASPGTWYGVRHTPSACPEAWAARIRRRSRAACRPRPRAARRACWRRCAA